MESTRLISGIEVARDLKRGMTESQIMEKYDVSFEGLQRLFRNLVEAKAIHPDELFLFSPSYRKETELLRVRATPRFRIPMVIPIRDVETLETGLVRDISLGGLRVAGIRAEAEDIKTFLLRLAGLPGAGDAMVLASCRWATIRGRRIKYPVAGFEITHLSKQSRLLFREFIESLRLRDAGEPDWLGTEQAVSDFAVYHSRAVALELGAQVCIKEKGGTKPVEKRKINGRSVADDVLMGLGDTALMEKYDLTSKQLESILKKLVDLGLIHYMQFYERTSFSDAVMTSPCDPLVSSSQPPLS